MGITSYLFGKDNPQLIFLQVSFENYLVKDLLRFSISEGREKDVVIFDVSDKDYPVGLNLLTVPQGVPPDIVASQALAVIRKLFEEQWSATQMEDALYATLRALVEVKNTTIMDIPRMFNDAEFRHKVLAKVDDPIVDDFWRYDFGQRGEKGQQQMARPISNRVRKFYRDPTMMRIVCQPKSLNFRRMMDEGKIFLASLSGVGEIESKTLGALLISKMQMAAMSRAGVENRKPLYLYIDEVQNFATTSLPVMFSEAGKYGLSLVVANQFMSQLSRDTLSAILGNVGTTIIFAVGVEDGPVLSRVTKPQFEAEDLINQDRFTTVVKMQVSGKTQPSFSMMTPLPKTEDDYDTDRVTSIKQHSREIYARPASEVDDIIKRARAGDERKTDKPEGEQPEDQKRSYYED